MGKIETATQWMIDLANDDSHGYDQDSRWGPDYDCSSSVISAWQYAGVPVKTKGASSTYDMKNVFLSCGFTNVISSVNVSTGAGLKRGDVLHRSGHTAMYIGNNKQVAAHLNEKGTTKGGKTGDQTGKEISVSAYSNSSSNPSWVLIPGENFCPCNFKIHKPLSLLVIHSLYLNAPQFNCGVFLFLCYFMIFFFILYVT